MTHRDNKIKGTLVLKSHYYEALNTLIYAFKTLSPFYYFTNLSLWSSGLAKIFLRDLDKNLKQNKNITAKQMYWILCCAGICKKGSARAAGFLCSLLTSLVSSEPWQFASSCPFSKLPHMSCSSISSFPVVVFVSSLGTSVFLSFSLLR